MSNIVAVAVVIRDKKPVLYELRAVKILKIGPKLSSLYQSDWVLEVSLSEVPSRIQDVTGDSY